MLRNQSLMMSDSNVSSSLLSLLPFSDFVPCVVLVYGIYMVLMRCTRVYITVYVSNYCELVTC